MKKITVVWDKRPCGTAFESVVGVFSDNDQAIAYCEHDDPKDVRLAADEFEIDALVEPEERRVAP